MTPTEFIAILPKFEQVDPDDIQRFLDRDDPDKPDERWGSSMTEALANWVAHTMSEEGVRGVPENVMPNARSGAEGGSWRADVYLLETDPYNTTVWGRKYVRLRDKQFAGAVTP